MFDPAQPNRICPRFKRHCPVDPCPGATDAPACDHWNRLATWRAVPTLDQPRRTEAMTPTRLDPKVRDAVNACPERGSILPLAEQADCGCLGREWTECRAGRGASPGKVTLRECLACQTERLGLIGERIEPRLEHGSATDGNCLGE